MSEQAQEIIDRYRQAYRNANGEDCGPITYESRWFVFKRGFPAYSSRYRKAKLIEMTEVLERRASEG